MLHVEQSTARPTNGIQYVQCAICGADDTIFMFHASVLPHQRGTYDRDLWAVVRCRRCGFVYLNPRPSPAALQNFYSYSDAGDCDFVRRWFVEGADLQSATWRRLLRVIRPYCPTGRLLDVGCGAGSFLVTARASGYDVAGEEVSPWFAAVCRQDHNLSIYEGDLEALDLPAGSFDCITAFDVIEHHPDPGNLLKQIYRLLKPGGLVVITTHDIGNLLARLYGPRWRLMSPIGHLTFFTRQSLAGLLKACGFRLVRQGGLNTIDAGRAAELVNWVTGFVKLILLRSVILWGYRPLAKRIPALRRWRIPWRGSYLDHDRLLLRTGNQAIINDDMVLLARR
jgi:SAM-dependent methyltransferase